MVVNSWLEDLEGKIRLKRIERFHRQEKKKRSK